MNEEIMQEELTPEEAKASLGLATRLQEQFLMTQMLPKDEMMPPDGQETPQNGTGNEMMSESEKEPHEDKMMAMEGKMDEKMEILRTELKETIKTEVGSIRDEIKSAIEDEN